MKNKRNNLLITKILFLIISIFVIGAVKTTAANQPLEIISPKAAGTGSPAIPTTHRIFYAYPGIEYKIRAAVVGGDYPYIYALNNEPAGMTINPRTGEIRWLNPEENANDIQLTVTDSENASISTTWSINVTTNGFKFVDDVASNGDGSLASPYNSIDTMIEGSDPTDIIYFREGSYLVPIRGDYQLAGHNTPTFSWRHPTDAPNRWLAFPEENVTIDLDEKFFYAYPTTSQAFYFEGLRFYNARHYFFRDSTNGGSMDYLVFLDCELDTLVSNEELNRNMGGFFTGAENPSRQQFYMVWQGNTFHNFRNAHAIGSLYGHDKLLIENNIFYDFGPYNGVNLHSNALALKVGLNNITVRGNYANFDEDSGGGFFGSSLNSPFYGSDNIEILFNFVRAPGVGSQFGRANAPALDPSYNSGEFWSHRNTFETTVNYLHIYEDLGNCFGPYTDNNNVYQNSSSGYSFHSSYVSGNYENCVASFGNVGGTSGLVNNTLLTEPYINYLGIAGWQFIDGETPISIVGLTYDTTPPSAPSGLNVS